MLRKDSVQHDHFVQLLTRYQTHLCGYITASVGDHVRAQDILQRTNVALLSKAEQFRSDAEFLPWAIAFARMEILADYRDRQRDRLWFCADVAELMTEAAAQEMHDIPDREQALDECLNKLPREKRELLNSRYVAGLSLAKLADRTGRSIDGVKSLMVRTRKNLRECVARKLASQLED